MPLYAFVKSLIHSGSILAVISSGSLLIAEAFLLNSIVTSAKLLQRHTYLPLLFYVLLMAIPMQTDWLHPALFSNLFILLALKKFFKIYLKDDVFSNVFDAGFFIAVGSLFHLAAGLFFIVTLLGLVFLRSFYWREWVISLMGFLLPYFFLGVYYYLTGGLVESVQNIFHGTLPSSEEIKLFVTPNSFAALPLAAIVFFTSFSIAEFHNAPSLKMKNYSAVLLLFAIVAVFTLILKVFYSRSNMAFLSIPLSIYWSYYFLGFKAGSYRAELLFILITGSLFFIYLTL